MIGRMARLPFRFRLGPEAWMTGLAWTLTRSGLLLVGVLALQLLPSAGNLMAGNLRYHTPRSIPLETWARWDSEWYLLIADRGYAGSREVLARYPKYGSEDAAGFFPLYPFLVRIVGGTLGDAVLGGIVVSNLCLLWAIWLLARLVRLEHGIDAARYVPWILAAFPTSLFLSAVYAESLFLALAIGSLYAARRDRWWSAGILACLGSLTRPLGFLLVVPLAWEFLVLKERRVWKAVPLALAPLGTGGFLLFCQVTYGDFLAPLERQLRWRGVSSGPWRAFVRFLEAPEIHGAHHSVIDLVAALGCLLAIPLLFRYLRPSYALYACVMMAAPLCTSLWSFSRLCLAIFPLFHLLALGCSRWRGFLPGYLSLALPLGGFFMALFANGWWVG